MIKCFKSALCESCERSTKKKRRWLTVWSRTCTSFVVAEQRSKALWRCILTKHFLTLSISLFAKHFDYCNIIAEGFFFILSFFVLYILPFGLVRLRTFCFVRGLVRCTHWVQVFTHTQGRCDNQRCHNKNPR